MRKELREKPQKVKCLKTKPKRLKLRAIRANEVFALNMEHPQAIEVSIEIFSHLTPNKGVAQSL